MRQPPPQPFVQNIPPTQENRAVDTGRAGGDDVVGKGAAGAITAATGSQLSNRGADCHDDRCANGTYRSGDGHHR